MAQIKNPIPETGKKAWFDNLRNLSERKLIQMGVKIWNKQGGKTHYLYPAYWYKEIPNGLPIVGISGKKELFKRGVSDDDQRFGALPYGFIK